MRDLIFIQACPDDDYFVWQVRAWLESLREIGKSEKAVSLVLTPFGRNFNTKWYDLVKEYKESEFVFIQGNRELNKHIPIYIPIIRPYCLKEYFEANPELCDKAIFYCDADILFTKNFNVDKYLDDEICYLSNTISYVGASYFDSKIKDVLPEKLEEYKKIDVLNSACSLVGINREIAVKNNENSGGAQYLLKGVDAFFWQDVYDDCLKIRIYLQEINRTFFQNESKGFQSWATDMFSLLWNLWFLGKETRIIPEMDFAWSSDPIERVDQVGIFHNAGIAGEIHGNTPVFYKGKYHRGISPFSDPQLEKLYTNEQTKKLANWYYISKLINLKHKYNLD